MRSWVSWGCLGWIEGGVPEEVVMVLGVAGGGVESPQMERPLEISNLFDISVEAWSVKLDSCLNHTWTGGEQYVASTKKITTDHNPSVDGTDQMPWITTWWKRKPHLYPWPQRFSDPSTDRNHFHCRRMTKHAPIRHHNVHGRTENRLSVVGGITALSDSCRGRCENTADRSVMEEVGAGWTRNVEVTVNVSGDTAVWSDVNIAHQDMEIKYWS